MQYICWTLLAVCLSAIHIPAFKFCACVLHPAVIPNAKEIEAAKRRRRATRAQKEFIPLSKDAESSPGSTPDHYSREDDDDEDRVDGDDDEPDDHERRIEFAPRLKSIRERIAEKLGMRETDKKGDDVEREEGERPVSEGVE